VVALSGGADSAGYCGRFCPGLELSRPAACAHTCRSWLHCRRRFGESCAALCRRSRFPDRDRVVVETPPRIDEAAARDARYAALEEALKPASVVDAHHREDSGNAAAAGLRGAVSRACRHALCRPLGRVGICGRSSMYAERAAAFGARAAGAPSWIHERRICVLTGLPAPASLALDRVALARRGATLARTAGHAADAQDCWIVRPRPMGPIARRRRPVGAGLRVMSAPERINALRFWLCDANVEPPAADAERALSKSSKRKPSFAVVVWGDHALRRYRQRVFLTEAEPPRLEGTRHCARTRFANDLGPNLGTLRWNRNRRHRPATLAGDRDRTPARRR